MSRIPLHPPKANYLGLWLAGGKEASPPGSYRRLIGSHRIHTGPLRSRVGSTSIQAATAHSLYRFGTHRFAGVGKTLTRDGAVIYSGFGGGRLAFVRMPPQPGKTDSLFVTDGTQKIKVDTAGNVTEWGIDAPPDGFLATLNAAQTVQIDNFDTAATWAGTTATLTDEGTIKQEGVNAMKMAVAQSATGIATKAIALDLSVYPGAIASPLEDYIQIWVRVDNPTNLNFLQVDFDVGNGTFSTDYYTRPIIPTSAAVLAAGLSSQAAGIADLFTPTIAPPLPPVPVPAPVTQTFPGNVAGHIPLIGQDTQSSLNTLGQTSVPSAAGVWVRLRLPKATFNRIGINGNTWSNVAAMRLTVQANATGAVNVYWDDARMSGGAGMQGTYQYQITYKNSTTGSRSNSNKTAVQVVGNQQQSVNLTLLPVSTDPQVDQKEIWRTLGGGALPFLADTIPNAQTVYTDAVADFTGLNSIIGAKVLASTQLPLDNFPPPVTMTDAVGSFLGSLWWLDSANPGNVYFSPVGRPEGNEGFVQVTNTDDPCQKLVIWNGLYVITQKTIYQIQGTFPAYTAAVILGTQGTSAPYTVQACPYGIVYWSDEGFRLFNGIASQLANFAPLGPLFNGEGAEGIPAFLGLVAGYAREEYVVSDGINTTLALNIPNNAWRNLGVVGTGFFYEWDTRQFQMAIPGNVVLFEDTVALPYTDAGAGIPFTVEWPSGMVDVAQSMTVERLYLDLDTQGQAITPTIIVDGVETALAVFNTNGRALYEYARMDNARLFGLRLSGTFTKQVIVYKIELDARTSIIVGGAAGDVTRPQQIQLVK